MAEVVRQNTYTVGKHSVFSHRGIGKVTLEHGESESGSVMSDSSRPHGRYSPWNSPGRILEWVALPFSRGSSQPRDQTGSRALQAGSLPVEPQGKPKNIGMGSPSLLQWIFLTQESNWGLLHCKLILYQLSNQGAWNMVRSAWLLRVTRECASWSESWRIRGGGEGTFKVEVSMCSSRLPSLQKILSMSDNSGKFLYI